MSNSVVELNHKNGQYLVSDKVYDTFLNQFNASEIKEIIKEETRKFVYTLCRSDNNRSQISIKSDLDEAEMLSELLLQVMLANGDEAAMAFFEMGRFQGGYDAFNLQYKCHTQRAQDNEVFFRIINKKHVKDILKLIYNNPGIQNKRLLELLNDEAREKSEKKISASYLNELANKLENCDIINRYYIGKNTYYEIAFQARNKVNRYCIIDEQIDVLCRLKSNDFLDKITTEIPREKAFRNELMEEATKDLLPINNDTKHIIPVITIEERGIYNYVRKVEGIKYCL